MGDFSEFPETHRRTGRFFTRLEDGTQVSLEIHQNSRPIRGHELVKASMAMRMGRPVEHRVNETSIAIFVGRAGRMDVEVTPSGHYRYGRHMQRSLRALVQEMADRIAPQRPSVESEDPPSGFSR